MTLLDPTTDFYGIFTDVSGEDLDAWQLAHSFGDEVLPVIGQYWENAEYPTDLVRRLAELDLLTDGIEVEGHQKLSALGRGLVNMEVSRIDGSMAVAIGVQAALAMNSIARFGSEEQKKQWLGPLAKAEKLGAFALTEPNHGSDAVALETTAVLDGDEYVLNGEKRWIGNGAGGDVSVVWARMDDGQVGGFLVEQDRPGYDAEIIRGKVSLRSIHQAHIRLTDCRIPASNRLPGASSFKDASAVLESSRAGVAWSALGHGIAAYEIALQYSQERVQFGRPLAHNQLIQQRLSNMLTDVTNMALQCRELARLEEAGQKYGPQAAMAKVHNTRAARRVVADARDMLGGSGILLENHVIRHFADMEALHTFEGTDTIQSLIIGRTLTGTNAFK